MVCHALPCDVIIAHDLINMMNNITFLSSVEISLNVHRILVFTKKIYMITTQE